MTNLARRWCLAGYIVDTDDSGRILYLQCDLHEDHAASEFPKYLHYDRQRNILWCEPAEL